MGRTDNHSFQPVGRLADDHELSARARRYGERVVSGTEWPIEAVDCAKITWATSTRAKRRHGRCSYDGHGQVTITLTEHTYDRAGFGACKKTIRHELVHAWQYHHRGEQAVVTDSGVEIVDVDSDTHETVVDQRDPAVGQCGADADTAVEKTTAPTPVSNTEPAFEIDTGHGDSFRAWVEPLELPGRCSRYYDRRRADFAYVYACPDCGNWWGKHRLCKSVRQAAHGGKGSMGYRYCTDCEVLLHLRAGDVLLAHGNHDDETIKAFVEGEFETVRSAVDEPLLELHSATGTPRPE